MSHERLAILPRHFGRHMLTVEHAVYDCMRELSSQYDGGYWHYYELSNGGFYMAPAADGPLMLRVATNGFEGLMGADAAGITACLFTISQLSFRLAHESITERFHQLREYALNHTEAGPILAAID